MALADAYSRVTAGERIGVCTVQGGVNGAGLQYSYPGLAQAFEDNSPMLCITDGIPAGSSENTPVRCDDEPEDRIEVVRVHRPSGTGAGVHAAGVLDAAERATWAGGDCGTERDGDIRRDC